MQYVMVQMGKKCSSRLYLFNVFERFVQAEMRRVWLDPNAIENEDVEVLQTLDRIVGDEVQIGSVCKVVKAISDHGEFAMDDLERCDLQTLTDTKLGLRKDRVRDQLRKTPAEVRWLKDVLKDSAKVAPRDLVRIHAHCTMAEIERPDIVEPEDVIDVTVRYEDRIEAIDFCS